MEKEVNGHMVTLSQEPIAVLDDAGNQTGEISQLEDIVNRGLWCKSTHVWIINSRGELYLQQRSFAVFNNPGKWAEASGGYVTHGYTSLEIAFSEIHEELGLLIPKDRFEFLGVIRQYENRADGKPTKQFVDVYLVRHDFTEAEITHCKRDVARGMLIPWQEFEQKLKAEEIDFVPHGEEINLVLATIRKSVL